MAKRILVVDDSSIIRSHCRTVLERAGYEVVEACDALSARTVLKTTEIAFLLCDLNLPGFDGIELIGAMRKTPNLAQLPAAIFTVESHAEMMERAESAGVTLWLRKPYKSEDLLAAVAKYAGPA
jgi:CheY-like chemotaxis protein